MVKNHNYNFSEDDNTFGLEKLGLIVSGGALTHIVLSIYAKLSDLGAYLSKKTQQISKIEFDSSEGHNNFVERKIGITANAGEFN